MPLSTFGKVVFLRLHVVLFVALLSYSLMRLIPISSPITVSISYDSSQEKNDHLDAIIVVIQSFQIEPFFSRLVAKKQKF